MWLPSNLMAPFGFNRKTYGRGRRLRKEMRGDFSCAFLKSTRPPESSEHKEAGKVERI